jgi:hypothetical protein
MAATRTRDGHEEALIRICAALTERVELLEAAVGQVAAQLHGVSGSGRVGATMPQLAELLRQHETSGRFPTTPGSNR